MGLFLAAGLMAAADETLVLKESVRVTGRFVRLTDLVETSGLSDAARARLGGVYLGRAPEEARPRVLTPDDIRRELERRGVNPETFTFAGERVEITSGADSGPLRRAIALEAERSLKSGAIDIVDLKPEGLPSNCRISQLRERGVLEFDVLLIGPEAKSYRARAVGRASRAEPVATAPEVETPRPEPAEIRERPSGPSGGVRKGDLVRATSSAFEVDARALEDGVPGQVILLEYVGSKNRFRATVSAAGRVEVPEAPR